MAAQEIRKQVERQLRRTGQALDRAEKSVRQARKTVRSGGSSNGNGRPARGARQT